MGGGQGIALDEKKKHGRGGGEEEFLYSPAMGVQREEDGPGSLKGG